MSVTSLFKMLGWVKKGVAWSSAGAAATISTSNLQTRLEDKTETETETATGKKLLLLDCRSKVEFAVSRLSIDSLNLPVRLANKDSIRELLNQTSSSGDVICYCSVGYRSGQVALIVAEELAKSGRHVFNLEGGLFQWARENRPFIGQGVHPYNRFT